jgi:putative ABC transport system permease protein
VSVLSDVVARLRALVFRGREEREMDEEFQFHLDMAAQRLQAAGWSEAEARRRSRLLFGGVERVKEETRASRGTQMVHDAIGDATQAVRRLRGSPRFTAVAVLTLAIGIGGTTAVFSAIDAVLLQPLPYQQPGQLMRLYQYRGEETQFQGFVSGPHYRAYRADLASFDGVAATYTYNQEGADIGAGMSAERIRVLRVTAAYFGVMRAQPVLGRAFRPSEEVDAPVAIVSDRLWERVFGGRTDAIGTVLTMNGVPRTIVGVMAGGFTDPVIGDVDAWLPLDVSAAGEGQSPGNHYLTVVGRLRPGVGRQAAQAELDALGSSLATLYPDVKDTHARLVPLKEDIVGPATRTLELVLGAVGLVLLLVCVNLANLLLVRGSERSRELAVRAALGAERSRLIRQLLTESVVLALIGGVAGLVLGRLAMPAIAALGSGSIPRLAGLSLNWPVLAFTFGLASASAIVFGLVPALRGSRTQPATVMRAQSQATTGSRSLGRLRAALVVSQVALAFLLLIGAGLLLASVDQLRRTDLGVVTGDILTFELHLPAARYDSTARARFYDAFARDVEAVPGVRAAGGVSKIPATGSYNTWGTQPLSGPLAGEPNYPQSEERVVAGDYFRAVGIRLLRGRLFDARDVVGAPHRVVISALLADRIFPGIDPVGQQLRTGDLNCEVIGVVNDVAVDPEGATSPFVYHAHRQYAGDRNWALTQVVAVSGSPTQMAPAIRRRLTALDPELVLYRPTTLDDAIGQGRAQRVFTLRILMTFAGVALALVAVGLFGVLSYAVRLRSKEIGIRVALGADAGTIRGMVLREGAIVTALGIGLGLLGAVALTRTMASVIFRVSPLDPGVLLGATLFMALVATIAAYLPARHATSVAPQSVLQGD